MAYFYNDSIFWVEIEKINPNPFQPRKEFDEAKLRDLSESIRQYGILQPLVVTRKEYTTEEGGLAVQYELISGERRLRASKLAGLLQVPVLIRDQDEDDLVKLELAIIENLQREDLNCVDRARAFQKLVDEFHFKHAQIGEKVGKSREYVSNTLRILALPNECLDALSEGKISEGHTRPLLMLADRPEEQLVLFKEILYKKLTVRETESVARRIAFDRVRKKELLADPEIAEFEEKMAESLGTRVRIEKKDKGGKIMIDYFSTEDLREILQMMEARQNKDPQALLKHHIERVIENSRLPKVEDPRTAEDKVLGAMAEVGVGQPVETEVVVREDNLPVEVAKPEDDRSKEEITKAEEGGDEDLYSIKNFTV